MENTNLANKDLRKTFLHKTNLKGASLVNSELDDSFLHGADLTNTDLSFTRLFSVDFSMIKNKDLSTAKIYGSGMGHADFTGVIMPEEIAKTNFSKSIMKEIDLSDRRVIGSMFLETDLEKANLKNADFSIVFSNVVLYDFGQYPPIGIPENEVKSYIISKIDSLPVIYLLSGTMVEEDLHVEFIVYNQMQKVDLEGANLEGANLKCMNHVICE